MLKPQNPVLGLYVALGILIAISAILAFRHGGGDDVKSRVPVLQEQIDQARQSAKDAEDAAQSAEQTKKDIQAAIDNLNNQWRNSDGTLKVGHPETTNAGIVTDVGSAKNTNGTATTYTVWFTFVERGGFVKKFVPVCPNQAIPTVSTVVLNFHWKEYSDSDDPGCYVIDSYTVVR